jgi:hypothetical protein
MRRAVRETRSARDGGYLVRLHQRGEGARAGTVRPPHRRGRAADAGKSFWGALGGASGTGCSSIACDSGGNAKNNAVGSASQIPMTDTGQRVTYLPNQPKIDLFFIRRHQNVVRHWLTTTREVLMVGHNRQLLVALSLASPRVSDARASQSRRIPFSNNVVR